MSEKIMDRLAEWVKTGPGRRWFEQVDREAKAREEAVAERRALVRSISEAQREEREELPRLRAAVAETDAVLHAAKAAYEKADRARYEAGLAASRCVDRVRQEVRRAEGRLRLTCDPRLADAQELLGDVRRDWDRIQRRLAQRVRAEEWMAVRSIITNTAELEALRKELRDADDAIEAAKLVAEPTEEEILAVLARAHRAAEAVGWHVPQAVQS